MSRLREIAIWSGYYLFWLCILWGTIGVLVIGAPEIKPFRYMNF